MVTEATTYRREYTIRRARPPRKTIEVTFPYEVVEAKAEALGMTVREFMSRYNVDVRFGFPDNGVLYTFKEKTDRKYAANGC